MENTIPNVNGHIHTPYSFSAFNNMEQAFEMAKNEGIKVLGINDFNTFNGYDEFSALSKKYKVYPMFNVEFMGLLQKEQQAGIRINDPNNPGRIYFSGKGLDYPVKLKGRSLDKFNETFEESNRQTRAMLEKASAWLKGLDAEINLDYETVMKTHTSGMLRERHIAKAIRTSVMEKYTEEVSFREAMKKLFAGKELKSSIDNVAGVDNEIRSNMLKSGGPAFVPEDPKAFLPLDDILEIIIKAGGIPCYPVLLDDPKGNYTEYEADMEKLHHQLQSREIYSVELIPGRNDINHLKRFVDFFHQQGYIITFGTEHNTPELIPLTVDTRGNIPLDDYLKKINFEGVCIIAAHQFLIANWNKGIDWSDLKIPHKRDELITLGRRVIDDYCK